jgi:hypothetical protein
VFCKQSVHLQCLSWRATKPDWPQFRLQTFYESWSVSCAVKCEAGMPWIIGSGMKNKWERHDLTLKLIDRVHDPSLCPWSGLDPNHCCALPLLPPATYSAIVKVKAKRLVNLMQLKSIGFGCTPHLFLAPYCILWNDAVLVVWAIAKHLVNYKNQ